MKYFRSLLIVALFLILPIKSFAQECGRSYLRFEQRYVKSFILGDPSKILARLLELAVQSNQLDLTPRTQRSAMDHEYQALLTYLTQLGDGPHKRTTKVTSAFLGNVVDASYLGLAGTTVDGPDKATAIANTYAAIRAVYAANQKMWSCY